MLDDEARASHSLAGGLGGHGHLRYVISLYSLRIFDERKLRAVLTEFRTRLPRGYTGLEVKARGLGGGACEKGASADDGHPRARGAASTDDAAEYIRGRFFMRPFRRKMVGRILGDRRLRVRME